MSTTLQLKQRLAALTGMFSSKQHLTILRTKQRMHNRMAIANHDIVTGETLLLADHDGSAAPLTLFVKLLGSGTWEFPVVIVF